MSCREEECSKLYEIVKDRLPALSHVEFQFTSKGLLIEVYGYESDVKSAWHEIKKVAKALKEALSTRSSMKKYSVDFIVQVIKKTFSPELLVEILRRMGHRALYVREENTIFSDVSFEEITKLAGQVAEKNSLLAKISRNTSTRYYLVACSILTSLTIDDIIEISRSLGLLDESENGRFIVKTDWRSAVDKFYKYYKQSISEK